MNVILTQPVEIALRTLGLEDRRNVSAWLDRLKNWGSDPVVRQHAHKLPSREDVRVLRTDTDFRIFFELRHDQVTVLDIATKATISAFGNSPATRE
jgi:hypothetical protein